MHKRRAIALLAMGLFFCAAGCSTPIEKPTASSIAKPRLRLQPSNDTAVFVNETGEETARLHITARRRDDAERSCKMLAEHFGKQLLPVGVTAHCTSDGAPMDWTSMVLVEQDSDQRITIWTIREDTCRDLYRIFSSMPGFKPAFDCAPYTPDNTKLFTRGERHLQ